MHFFHCAVDVAAIAQVYCERVASHGASPCCCFAIDFVIEISSALSRPANCGFEPISSSIAFSNALSHSAFEIFGPVLLGLPAFPPLLSAPAFLSVLFPEPVAAPALPPLSFGMSLTLFTSGCVGSDGAAAAEEDDDEGDVDEVLVVFGLLGSSPARRDSDVEFAGVLSSAL